MSERLYLATRSDEPSWLKVGITRDVAPRMREIGRVLKVSVNSLYSEELEFAEAVERAMHYRLRDFHRDGEWFEVTLERALIELDRLRALPRTALERQLGDPKVSLATMVKPEWKARAEAQAKAEGLSVAVWLERLVAHGLGEPFVPRPKWQRQLKLRGS